MSARKQSLKKLTDILEEIYRDGEETDCRIVMPDGREFKAIKFLLCLYSDYFKNLFNKNPQLDSIKIDDVDDNIMRAFLDYIHLNLDLEDMKLKSIQIYELADRFEMPNTKSIFFNSLTHYAAETQEYLLTIKDTQWSMLNRLLLELVAHWKQKLGDKYSWSENDARIFMETVERERLISSALSSKTNSGNNSADVADLNTLNATVLRDFSRLWLQLDDTGMDERVEQKKEEVNNEVKHKWSTAVFNELSYYFDLVYRGKITASKFVAKMKLFSESEAPQDQILISHLREELLNGDKLREYVAMDKSKTGLIFGGLMQNGVFSGDEFHEAVKCIVYNLPEQLVNNTRKRRKYMSVFRFGEVALRECRSVLYKYPESCVYLLNEVDENVWNNLWLNDIETSEQLLLSYIECGASGQLPPSCREAMEEWVHNTSKSTLTSLLKNAFKSGDLADCEIHTKDKVIKANKFLLCIQSAFFKKMFEHNMQEKTSGVVKLTEYDPRIIEQMIRFIHTGELEGLEPEDKDEVFQMADFFEIEQFRIHYTYAYRNHISWDTLEDALQLVYLKNDLHPQPAVFQFLSKNMKEFIEKEENWKDLDPKIKISLLLNLKLQQKRVRITPRNSEFCLVVTEDKSQLSLCGKRFHYTLYNATQNCLLYKVQDMTPYHEISQLDYGCIGPLEFIGFETEVTSCLDSFFQIHIYYRKRLPNIEFTEDMDLFMNTGNWSSFVYCCVEYDPFSDLE